MARTRDPEVHALRRDEFVDVALRLMQTKGWDATSIQDVLAETGASKGAFYHYFSSKADLLEAVIERITDAATASLHPAIDDPALSSMERFAARLRRASRAGRASGPSCCWPSSRSGAPTTTRSSARSSASCAEPAHRSPPRLDRGPGPDRRPVRRPGPGLGRAASSSRSCSAPTRRRPSCTSSARPGRSRSRSSRRAWPPISRPSNGSSRCPRASLALVDREALIQWFG